MNDARGQAFGPRRQGLDLKLGAAGGQTTRQLRGLCARQDCGRAFGGAVQLHEGSGVRGLLLTLGALTRVCVALQVLTAPMDLAMKKITNPATFETIKKARRE